MLLAAVLVAPPARAQAAKGVAELLGSVVTVHARAVAAARDPARLGAERRGSGIVVEPGLLVLTSATFLQETAGIVVTTADGRTVPATIVCQDSGIDAAVLRAAAPLAVPGLPLGAAGTLAPRTPVAVLSAARTRTSSVAFVVGRGEYAAPWEQLVDDALFTSPAIEDSVGAALVDGSGRLVGIGTLGRIGVELPSPKPPATGNVFIPVEAFHTLLSRATQADVTAGPRRPWLGLVVDSVGGELVVSRVLRNSPAERADLRAGDVIVAVDGEAATSRAALYRRVWRLGRPGAEIRLAVRRDALTREVRVRTMDVGDYLIQQAAR
jgi:S1-C subfamily serine protease